MLLLSLLLPSLALAQTSQVTFTPTTSPQSGETATTVRQGAVAAPSLAEGQVWHLTVKPLPSMRPAVEAVDTRLTLAPVTPVKGGVLSHRAYSGLGRVTDEMFSVVDDGQAPRYALVVLMGVRVDKLFVQLCVISNPHDHLNEPQTGLYHETRGNDFFTPHISQYLSTGSLGQGQTCTLTRLK